MSAFESKDTDVLMLPDSEKRKVWAYIRHAYPSLAAVIKEFGPLEGFMMDAPFMARVAEHAGKDSDT